MGEGGGGWLFVVAGVLVAGLGAHAFVRGFRRDAQVALVVLALGVLGVGSWVYSDISHQFKDLRASIDQSIADVGGDEVTISSNDVVSLKHGVGLYVVLAGGALALIGAPRSYGKRAGDGTPAPGP